MFWKNKKQQKGFQKYVSEGCAEPVPVNLRFPQFRIIKPVLTNTAQSLFKLILALQYLPISRWIKDVRYTHLLRFKYKISPLTTIEFLYTPLAKKHVMFSWYSPKYLRVQSCFIWCIYRLCSTNNSSFNVWSFRHFWGQMKTHCVQSHMGNDSPHLHSLDQNFWHLTEISCPGSSFS